ncbi:MAG: hypothetical protein VZQ80_03375 [Lachnospiraceae bacterium]|nr:hypothetical protein [Lachnospiraceae bacterium]
MKYIEDFYKDVPERIDRYKEAFLPAAKDLIKELQDERHATINLMAGKAGMSASTLSSLLASETDPKLMTVAGIVRGGLGMKTGDFFARLDQRLEGKSGTGMQVLIETAGRVAPEDQMEAVGILESYIRIRKNGHTLKITEEECDTESSEDTPDNDRDKT